MSTYTVTPYLSDIDFLPSTEAEEILQCVRCILCTPKWSVPLDRDFGVDMEALDRPLPVAQAKLSSEIVTALKEYEPRVEVTDITWDAQEDGVLMPTVTINVVE